MNAEVALFASSVDGGAITCWCVMLMFDRRHPHTNTQNRDLTTGSQLCQYKSNASNCNCTALLGDQYLVAAQCGKGPLLFWAWHQDAPLQRAFAAGPVTCVAASACGTYLAAGSASGAVWVWDVPSGRLAATWEAHFKSVSALAWSSSATFLVSGGEDTQVCVALLSDLLDVRRSPQQPYQAMHSWCACEKYHNTPT